MRTPEQEESLRQTGRTTRMLERCLTYRGDGGIVFIVGRKESAAEVLHRRFAETALAAKVPFSVTKRCEIVVDKTTYRFISEGAVETVTRGMRPTAVEYDNDTDHEWNR